MALRSGLVSLGIGTLCMPNRHYSPDSAMQHITILSEDRVFSSLLARNLETQGHKVDIHLLNPQLPLSFLVSPITWSTRLWILDLNWFYAPNAPAYNTLAEWCRSITQPIILLLDTSWDPDSVSQFHAASTITKPFAMAELLRLVHRTRTGSSVTPTEHQTFATSNRELAEKSSVLFETWVPVHHRIVVPLDGSHLAESILPVVSTIAAALELEVMLLYVMPEDDKLTHEPTPPQGKAAEDVQGYLKALGEAMISQGVPTGWRLTSGSPVESILKYAAEAPADLIAMSTHGAGNNISAPIGSVAAAVLEKQTRPVLLIKPDQEAMVGREDKAQR